MKYIPVSVPPPPTGRGTIMRYVQNAELRYAVALAVWETRSPSEFSNSVEVRNRLLANLGWSPKYKRRASNLIAALKRGSEFGFLLVKFPPGCIQYGLPDHIKDILGEGVSAFGVVEEPQSAREENAQGERQACIGGIFEALKKEIIEAAGEDSVKGEYIRRGVLYRLEEWTYENS